MQTAVEWLMPNVLGLTLQLSNNRISQRTCELKILELFEQAKEMEKQQIISAYRSAYGKDGKSPNMIALGKIFDKQTEQYYNETFKK